MPKGVYKRTPAEKARLIKQIISHRGSGTPLTGKIIKCKYCRKEKYFPGWHLKRNTNHFCSRQCANNFNWLGKPQSLEQHLKIKAKVRRENHGMWKGGRYLNQNGYVMILKPEHPSSDINGYVREHRVVMEKKLGRFLKRFEVVHHIDHNKINNKITNLMLFSSQMEHKKYEHQEIRKQKNVQGHRQINSNRNE